jgi:DNA-directed RNA polymerase specialized sigma24 family protein
MITIPDYVTDIFLGRIDAELLLKSLPPKDRDTLTLWLQGGYKCQEIAEIIKIRYKEPGEVDGMIISARIQTILTRLKAKMNKRSKRIKK